MCILTEFGNTISLNTLLNDAYKGIESSIKQAEEEIKALSGDDDACANIEYNKRLIEDLKKDEEIVTKILHYYAEKSSLDLLFSFVGGKPVITHKEYTLYHE